MKCTMLHRALHVVPSGTGTGGVHFFMSEIDVGCQIFDAVSETFDVWHQILETSSQFLTADINFLTQKESEKLLLWSACDFPICIMYKQKSA